MKKKKALNIPIEEVQIKVDEFNPFDKDEIKKQRQ